MAYSESTIGQRITEARESKGMSRAALARKLDKSDVTIARWENGEYDPKSNDLLALGNALSVSPAYLLLGTGESTSAPEEDGLSPKRTTHQAASVNQGSGHISGGTVVAFKAEDGREIVRVVVSVVQTGEPISITVGE